MLFSDYGVPRRVEVVFAALDERCFKGFAAGAKIDLVFDLMVVLDVSDILTDGLQKPLFSQVVG